ncbi:MAG: hypothetical protein IPG58_06695 [Acidobacteria bacterium]|nr:hypothetical protein [Acidobacteriota bacterium]
MQTPDQLLLQTLWYLATFRCFTKDQAIRLFHARLADSIQGLIDHSLANGYIANITLDIPIATRTKIRHGQTAVRPVSVYYIAAKGKRLLKKHSRGVKFLKTSRPVGTHRRRLYHDLLIVEVLIWMRHNYNVSKIYNEDRLRGMKENLADLRVEITSGSGTLHYIDCEVVVQNSRQDIEKKSDNLSWFTPSLTQADIIRKTKPINQGVNIINLDETEYFGADRTATLSVLESEILQTISSKGGTLTAAAMAKCLRRDRARTNTSLKALVRKGYLYLSSVHSTPGTQKGRPVHLFSVSRNLIETFEDRIFALRISNLILDPMFEGATVSGVDHDTRSVILSQNGNSVRIKLDQIFI